MKLIQTTAGRIGTIAAAAALALQAMPAAAFFDDFEDGDAAGWTQSTNGGNGSTGTEPHNGSQMAFVKHVGNGSNSLSLDLPYVANDKRRSTSRRSPCRPAPTTRPAASR